MATKELRNIFLSASIPLPERDSKYFETADIIAIRDAVTALANTVLSDYRLIWGGHPSITPIINYVIQRQGLMVQDHVILYQSTFFEKYFPEDNNKFNNVIQVEGTDEKETSLEAMRKTIFQSYQFYAGIFIGGMEGVLQEYDLFNKYHPEALVLPLASTGAAAKIIFNSNKYFDERFFNDYCYTSLFKDYLLKA